MSLLSLNLSPPCKVGKFKLHASLRFGGNEGREEKGRIFSWSQIIMWWSQKEFGKSVCLLLQQLVSPTAWRWRADPEGAGQCGSSRELCWESHCGSYCGSTSQINVFAKHLIAKTCLLLQCHRGEQCLVIHCSTMSSVWPFYLIFGSADTVSDPNSIVQVCRWGKLGRDLTWILLLTAVTTIAIALRMIHTWIFSLIYWKSMDSCECLQNKYLKDPQHMNP